MPVHPPSWLLQLSLFLGYLAFVVVGDLAEKFLILVLLGEHVLIRVHVSRVPVRVFISVLRGSFSVRPSILFFVSDPADLKNAETRLSIEGNALYRFYLDRDRRRDSILQVVLQIDLASDYLLVPEGMLDVFCRQVGVDEDLVEENLVVVQLMAELLLVDVEGGDHLLVEELDRVSLAVVHEESLVLQLTVLAELDERAVPGFEGRVPHNPDLLELHQPLSAENRHDDPLVLIVGIQVPDMVVDDGGELLPEEYFLVHVLERQTPPRVEAFQQVFGNELDHRVLQDEERVALVVVILLGNFSELGIAGVAFLFIDIQHPADDLDQSLLPLERAQLLYLPVALLDYSSQVQDLAERGVKSAPLDSVLGHELPEVGQLPEQGIDLVLELLVQSVHGGDMRSLQLSVFENPELFDHFVVQDEEGGLMLPVRSLHFLVEGEELLNQRVHRVVQRHPYFEQEDMLEDAVACNHLALLLQVLLQKVEEVLFGDLFGFLLDDGSDAPGFVILG